MSEQVIIEHTPVEPVEIVHEAPSGEEVVVQVEETLAVVDHLIEGPVGPEGPQGPVGSDLHYRHIQAVATDSVVVEHGLGKFPSITVKDTSQRVVIGTYTYIDEDNVQLDFSSAFSFEAVFN